MSQSLHLNQDVNSIAGPSNDDPVIQFNLGAEPPSDHQGFYSYDDHQVLISLNLPNKKKNSNITNDLSCSGATATRQSNYVAVTQSPPSIDPYHSSPPTSPTTQLHSEPLQTTGHNKDATSCTTNISDLNEGTPSLDIEHALVPVESLLMVVNNNLGNCKICQQQTLKMVKLTTMHLAQSFGIECTNCAKIYRAMNAKLYRLQQKIRQTNGTVPKSDHNKRTYLKRKIVQMKSNFESLKVAPLRTLHDSNAIQCNRGRSIGFEVNLRCMLACYWLGTGSSDMVKLFSMLGFGSMKHFTKCFTRNQATINEGIITVCKSIIHDSLINEITITMRQNHPNLNEEQLSQFLNLLQNKQFDNARTILQNIQLTVSYDMGWQKRAGGRVYDSLSGHAYMIGCLSGKVVQMGVLCKKCKTCSNFNRKDMEPPIHPYPVNHEASSGAMEARCCCTLLEEVCRKFDGIVTVGCLVTDDDSTLRSHCKTSGEGGKLAETTPTPRFLADPGHRIKVIGKALFGLVTKTKNIDEVRTVDVLRLKNISAFTFHKTNTKVLTSLSETFAHLSNICSVITLTATAVGVGRRIATISYTNP